MRRIEYKSTHPPNCYLLPPTLNQPECHWPKDNLTHITKLTYPLAAGWPTELLIHCCHLSAIYLLSNPWWIWQTMMRVRKHCWITRWCSDQPILLYCEGASDDNYSMQKNTLYWKKQRQRYYFFDFVLQEKQQPLYFWCCKKQWWLHSFMSYHKNIVRHEELRYVMTHNNQIFMCCWWQWWQQQTCIAISNDNNHIFMSWYCTTWLKAVRKNKIAQCNNQPFQLMLEWPWQSQRNWSAHDKISGTAIAKNAMVKIFKLYCREQWQWLNNAAREIARLHKQQTTFGWCRETTLTIAKAQVTSDNIDCNATTTMSTTRQFFMLYCKEWQQ